MAYKSAMTQVVIIGLIAFCCPGLFNALAGLGNAGADNPTAANRANTALYACFAVFGYFGGAVFNICGRHANRILMFLGGLTYASYAGGMYAVANQTGHKIDWVAPFVGALLGIGAGIFWTAQGAMMMAYATPSTKGKYIGVFWILFNLGGTLGGLLAFALNFHSEVSTASATSYFSFVGLMCLGSVAALLLLAPPDQVVREDGSEVVVQPAGSAFEEIKGAIMVATNPTMISLTLLFVASNWYYTFQLNYINGLLFNTRTRGLNSALYWGTQMLSAYLIGRMLDNPNWSRKRRGVTGYIYNAICFSAAWAMALALRFGFEEKWDKDHAPEDFGSRIDLTESHRSYPIIAFIFAAFADAALQAYAYWIMGAVAGADTSLSARFAGYYKGIQSAGAAIAWSLDLNCSYGTQLIVCIVLWVSGQAAAWFAVTRITEDDALDYKEAGSEAPEITTQEI